LSITLPPEHKNLALRESFVSFNILNRQLYHLITFYSLSNYHTFLVITMANNKKNNTFGAGLRVRVQDNNALTEPKHEPKLKRTKKSKKAAKAKAVKPSTRP